MVPRIDVGHYVYCTHTLEINGDHFRCIILAQYEVVPISASPSILSHALTVLSTVDVAPVPGGLRK